MDDEGFDSSLTTELMDGVTEGEKGPTMGQKIMEQLLELMKKLPSKYRLYMTLNGPGTLRCCGGGGRSRNLRGAMVSR